MTMHKSLKGASTLKRARNVLTRAERIKILEDDGRWKEGGTVFGLIKVRQYVMKRRKAEKKEEVAAEGAAAAPAAEAGKPAAKAPAGKTPAGKK